MNDTPQDSSRMMAAVQKAITDLKAEVARLQKAATDAKKSADAAKVAASTAEESAKKWKKVTRWLVAGVVVLLITAGISGYFVNQVRNNANQLRQQSITSCETGNQFRAGQLEIWEKNYALQADVSKATSALLTQLISTLAKGDPAEIAQINHILAQSGKANAAEVSQFLNIVKNISASKDCTSAFDNTTSVGETADSGNPSSAKLTALTTTTTTVYPENWNGYCLSIPNANVGTRVEEVPCASAHAWTYYSPSAELSPSGHPNVALGDSGGYPVLKATPTTDVTSVGPNRTGPGGFSYFQMNLSGTAGYYVHGNGNGQWVTLDGINGDGYNYWAFTIRGAAVAPGTMNA
jgi:hypothetical protein